MKKLGFYILSITLCLIMSISTFAIVPSGWYEISDEELGLPSEEEERAITEEQRNKNKAITDEMYAAFFAAEQGDLDSIPDVDIGVKYFGDMNYSTERYINPTFSNISRTYYCTDILMYAGHGLYDRMIMRPDALTSENHTGVYMGSSSISDIHGAKLVGLGKKSMSSSRFVMFAACQTANPNYSTNIAKSVVSNGATSSIGWRVDVSSQGLHSWETSFFSYIKRGLHLNDAKKLADLDNNGTKYPDILTSTIYGNGYVYLSKNRERSAAEEDSRLIQIKDTLNIDCESGDLSELTEYLEQNVEGFDSHTYQIELINNSLDGKNYYSILYGMQVNGFKTPNKVMVFVEDDKIEYASSYTYTIEDFASIPANLDENLDAIDEAKKLASEDIPAYATLDYQEVEKVLDKNLNPVLIVKTACVDEQGARFVLNYEYSLN